jgi:hypothetical protein
MTEAPPDKFIAETWDGQRVYEELRQWMEPAEAIRELNLFANKLPWYPPHGGTGTTIYTGAKLPSPMGSITWELSEREKVELVLPSGSVIAAKEAKFRTLPDAVRARWPMPAGGRKKSRRGRDEQFNWLAFDAELLRRVYTGEVGIHAKNTAIAKSLLEWCGTNWPNDIPSERSARDRVGGLLGPARKDDNK